MINLEEANLENIPVGQRDLIYIACESFARYQGYDMFFKHLKNLYVSSTLGLNEEFTKANMKLITDDYFRGGLDMMDFLQKQITEYSKAKSMSVNRAAPPTKA